MSQLLSGAMLLTVWSWSRWSHLSQKRSPNNKETGEYSGYFLHPVRMELTGSYFDGSLPSGAWVSSCELLLAYIWIHSRNAESSTCIWGLHARYQTWSLSWLELYCCHYCLPSCWCRRNQRSTAFLGWMTPQRKQRRRRNRQLIIAYRL